MNQWFKIYTSANLPQASIVKGMLEENHVPVMLVNNQDSSYLNFGFIEIYVPSHLKDIATNLIQKSLLN